jgi:hypothetical protein
VDPDVARLVSLMSELASLLAAHSHSDWSQWVAKDAALIRAGDGYGLNHFLSAFGGMGSLNDIILDGRSDQKRFNALKSEAWTLATALRREADTDD